MGRTTLQAVALSCVAMAALLTGCDRPPPSAAVTGATPVAPSDVAPEMADEVVTADAAAPGAPTARFHARGNEPFWSVKVDGASLVYTTPDTQPGVQLMGTRSESASGFEFHGSDGSRPFALVITPGRCEDSMSDQVYDYTASFNDGERVLSGCASEEE